MAEFRVQKILVDGTVKIEYTGTLRERTEELISIDTGWSREPLDLGYVLFEPDDVWIETFYLNEWYNIFRISSEEGALKGFYINITRPPAIEGDLIRWEDLAIDIWVRPDGSYLVLDEDEFEELDIDKDTRKKALIALKKVRDMVGSGIGELERIVGNVQIDNGS